MRLFPLAQRASQRVRVFDKLQNQSFALHDLINPLARPQSEPPNRFRRNCRLKRLGNLCLRHEQHNTQKTFEINQEPVIFRNYIVFIKKGTATVPVYHGQIRVFLVQQAGDWSRGDPGKNFQDASRPWWPLSTTRRALPHLNLNRRLTRSSQPGSRGERTCSPHPGW